MAYTPNPQDPTTPTIQQLAGNMAYELQALKGYIQSLVSSGNNFAYIGSLRNRLKNGGFNVAQRGTSVTVASGASGYTLDQWIVGSTGGATVVTQGVGGATANSSYLQLVPGAGTTAMLLKQKIESKDCQDFVAGKSLTISGLYSCSSLSPGLPSVTLYTPTVADNWAAETLAGTAQQLVISAQQASTLQFFSLTFPLLVDSTQGLLVQLSWPTSTVGYTLQFANLQLEVGAQYTQFEQRPVALEQAICQRYYELIETIVTPAGHQLITACPKVNKRVSPSLLTTVASGTGATFVPAGVTGYTTYYQLGNHSVVSAAVIAASAEL